jgi:hydrogenase-4 membrane subunit HyfE
MSILRKIFGIFLLILSVLLIPATLSSLINTITDIPKESGAEKTGYIFGCVFFALIMALIIYFMMKKGLRLLKNKPQNSIEEIGQL